MRQITPHDRATIGDTIRDRRNDLSISQRVLAKRASVAPGTIVAIEKGREVNDPKLRAVLRALDLELDTRGRETTVVPGGTPKGGTGLEIEVFLNMLRAWLVSTTITERGYAMDRISDTMRDVTDTIAGKRAT